MTEIKHKGLYVALAAAQAEMGKALKDTNNPHFKSKYADLSSVCDACMPALSRHGIAVLQPSYDDDTGRYIKTIFVHGESGEAAECRVPLIVAKNDMQGYGSAVTYARRYGLMGMAGIAPEDDDGNAAAAAPPKKERIQEQQQKAPPEIPQEAIETAKASIANAETLDQLRNIYTGLPPDVALHPAVVSDKDARKAALTPTQNDAPTKNADLDGDHIPY